MRIRDSSVVRAITCATRNMDVDYELDVTAKVAETIEVFNSRVDSCLRSWLSLQEPRPLFTVLAPVEGLNHEERDSFEATLFSYAHWVVIAGDKNAVLFGPADDYSHTKIHEYLVNYMIYNGRFCHSCNAFTEYKANKGVWVCPECGNRVGCHKGTDIAFGSVADQRTAKVRKMVHDKIDKLWKAGVMSRTEVYSKISDLLGVHRCYTHIAMLSFEQCEIVKKWATVAGKEVNCVQT